MKSRMSLFGLCFGALFLIALLSACGGGGGGGTSPEVSADNTAPVASAGVDQNIPTASVVTLDGTGSTDADGDTLTFYWTLNVPVGSSATLSDPTAVKPTFTADVEGQYTASLIVNDGTVDSDADTALVIAVIGNSAPVANAGPDQQIVSGNLVTLDGSGSTDADGDTLTYSWAFVSNPGNDTLSDPTAAQPTFTPSTEGTYELSLIVNDGTIDSAADTIVIDAIIGNAAPVSVAAQTNSLTAVVGEAVALDGSGSYDSDGTIVSYLWNITAQPAGSTPILTGSDTVSPTFTTDTEGVYVVQLTVTDNGGLSNTSTVGITVSVPPPLSILPALVSLQPSESSTMSVTIGVPAGVGGLSVALIATPGTNLSLPSSVTIAEGETSAQFTITAGSSSSIETVTASYGSLTVQSTVYINTPLPGIGVISGDVDLIDFTVMTSSASSIFQNSIDFGASGYDVSQFNDLTLGAQSIITAANDGGSSTLSVAFSFEVLGRSQSAVLLKTGDEILYDDPSSKTADYLVEINGHKIGVTTTRAVGFPPGTLSYDAGLTLLESKLGDVLISSAGVSATDLWEKQILHILAYDQTIADNLLIAYATLSDTVKADTIVFITVTNGADDFLYY